MKDLHKYLIYILPVLGIGALILLSRQQPASVATVRRGTSEEAYEESETSIIEGQVQVQAPASQENGMVETEVEESGMVEVTQAYTTQQEQNCAHAWLTQSCPEYQEYGCYTATMTNHTMTGDGTHYFTYTSSYFKEGSWGVPVPATMTFTVIIKNCQMKSYSYRT